MSSPEFNTSIPSQNIKSLSLNLIMDDEGSALSENAKQRLLQFENENLHHLLFATKDVPRNYDSLWDELSAFVKKNKLSFDISLPEPYQSSGQQRQIDQLTSDFRRQKNLADFQQIYSNHLPEANHAATRATIKRTRPRNELSLNIDTDLQSEQTKQTTTTLEMTLDNQLSSQVAVDCPEQTTYSTLINKEEFIQLCLGESHLSEKKYLFSKREAEKLWDSLFNNQVVCSKEYKNPKDALICTSTVFH